MKSEENCIGELLRNTALELNFENKNPKHSHLHVWNSTNKPTHSPQKFTVPLCTLEFSIAVNFSFGVNIFATLMQFFYISGIFLSQNLKLNYFSLFLLLVLNNLCCSQGTQSTSNY